MVSKQPPFKLRKTNNDVTLRRNTPAIPEEQDSPRVKLRNKKSIQNRNARPATITYNETKLNFINESNGNLMEGEAEDSRYKPPDSEHGCALTEKEIQDRYSDIAPRIFKELKDHRPAAESFMSFGANRRRSLYMSNGNEPIQVNNTQRKTIHGPQS